MAAPFCIEVSQILKTGRTVTFGRSPDSNVPLQSLEFPLLASRTHAELRLRGSHLFIRDLKSTNGTFVQDVRVAAEQLLQDEAIITFGGPRKVINQASSCPNPFSFKLVVHQLGINVLPAQVMISSFTPNIAETSKPMPAALPPPQQPPPPPPPSQQPIPQPDAVIDLTGVRSWCCAYFSRLCAMPPATVWKSGGETCCRQQTPAVPSVWHHRHHGSQEEHPPSAALAMLQSQWAPKSSVR